MTDKLIKCLPDTLNSHMNNTKDDKSKGSTLEITDQEYDNCLKEFLNIHSSNEFPYDGIKLLQDLKILYKDTILTASKNYKNVLSKYLLNETSSFDILEEIFEEYDLLRTEIVTELVDVYKAEFTNEKLDFQLGNIINGGLRLMINYIGQLNDICDLAGQELASIKLEFSSVLYNIRLWELISINNFTDILDAKYLYECISWLTGDSFSSNINNQTRNKNIHGVPLNLKQLKKRRSATQIKNLANQNTFKERLLSQSPNPFPIINLIPPIFCREVIHLGPARSGAKRYYSSSDINFVKQSDVAYLFSEDKNIPNIDETKVSDYLRSKKLLSALRKGSVGDKSIQLQNIEVKQIGSDKWVNLADTGYGLSQLLPIVFNAISTNSNTILVEQPETHLHPKLQADIGSIMVESVFTNEFVSRKNWIVETHSETILLRILKLIRDGQFKSDLLRVYYIDQNSNGISKINQMSVSSEGELLSQWPDGFFSTDIDEIF